MPAPVVERTPRTWVTRVGRDDLDGALTEIAKSGGGPVRWWVTEPSPDDDDVAAAHELTRERTLLQLRRPLPVDEPVPPITVRAFVPGRDEADWVRVNNRAFASHPEQGGWTVETLVAREAEPWFDPAGFLLHHDFDGALAGFVWTKVHSGTPRFGEIYVIAVDPDHGGHRLGRALTLAGLDWLHRERGIVDAMLYVDAANSFAVKLYESLGFARHHTDVAYAGAV